LLYSGLLNNRYHRLFRFTLKVHLLRRQVNVEHGSEDLVIAILSVIAKGISRESNNDVQKNLTYWQQ